MIRKLQLGSAAVVVGAAAVLGILEFPVNLGDTIGDARGDRGSPATDPSVRVAGEVARAVTLEPIRDVRLEESEGALIGELTSLDRDGRGRMAVADRMSGRVTVYDSAGGLLHRIGRSGEGPGEFVRPVDATILEDGRIAVVETGQPRLTLYDPATERARTFRLRDAHYGEAVAETERGLAVYVNRSGPTTPRVQVYDHGGAVVEAFHPERPEYREVPYWSAMTKGLMAAGDGQVVVGANLTLPFARYRPDGAPLDSIVRELPGWQPVPRPALGRFTGPDARRRFEAWRRTFPTLDAIEIYRDSLLIVAVERLDEEVLSTEVATYEGHVFDLESGELIHSLDLPGRLLHADREIHCLTGEPPFGWTVGQFALRLP